MEFDDATLKYNRIFHPGFIEESMALVAEQRRFVYYTSSDTAMKVLRSQELWFRNATVMNDFSEISYGLELIRAAFSGPEGERFRAAVEDIFSGTIHKAGELLTGWEKDWQFETYIACVSIHNPDEDQRGRLSMWRAYVNDLVDTLSDEDVAGRASEELHTLVDTVVVNWDAEAKVHRLELRGKLLEMLNATRPAGEAGHVECESSLKLVAGGRNQRYRTKLSCKIESTSPLKWSCFSGQVCGLAKMHLVCVHAALRVSCSAKYALSGGRLSSAVWGRSEL